MRHIVQFQFRPKNSERPLDEAQDFDFSADGPLNLPAVGDHVYLSDHSWGGGAALVVESRLFSYVSSGEPAKPVMCLINIVLTESGADFGRLLKE
jgi:hypothetical protein